MTKYFALSIDLDKTQYDSIESAAKINPYLIYELEKQESKNFNYINTHYSWSFYDAKGNFISEIILNNWRINNFEGVRSVSSSMWDRDQFKFDVIDPKGKIKSFVKSSEIVGIKFLRELSKYESLENYNLAEDNRILKQQNVKLLSENTDLKNKLGILP